MCVLFLPKKYKTHLINLTKLHCCVEHNVCNTHFLTWFYVQNRFNLFFHNEERNLVTMRNVIKLHFSVISLKNENENSSSTTENIIFTANFTDAKVCLQNLLSPASLSCWISVNFYCVIDIGKGLLKRKFWKNTI